MRRRVFARRGRTVAFIEVKTRARMRWCTDNIWTNAPVADLLPGLRKVADTLPPAPSHALWLNWYPPAQREDMAFSLEANRYFAGEEPWAKRKTDPERMRTILNDEVRQDYPVNDMVFSVAELVSRVSQDMTLEPGDLIATGTPGSVINYSSQGWMSGGFEGSVVYTL